VFRAQEVKRFKKWSDSQPAIDPVDTYLSDIPGDVVDPFIIKRTIDMTSPPVLTATVMQMKEEVLRILGPAYVTEGECAMEFVPTGRVHATAPREDGNFKNMPTLDPCLMPLSIRINPTRMATAIWIAPFSHFIQFGEQIPSTIPLHYLRLPGMCALVMRQDVSYCMPILCHNAHANICMTVRPAGSMYMPDTIDTPTPSMAPWSVMRSFVKIPDISEFKKLAREIEMDDRIMYDINWQQFIADRDKKIDAELAAVEMAAADAWVDSVFK
jgi:hypothetical protein